MEEHKKHREYLTPANYETKFTCCPRGLFFPSTIYKILPGYIT